MQRKQLLFVFRRGCLSVLATMLLSTCAWASTETLLHSFTSGSTDGGNPSSGLAADAAGNLYGTTQIGGNSTGCGPFGFNSCGVVFKLAPDGSGGWNYSVIYSFTGGADGGWPYSTPAIDSLGNLYVTTTQGGNAGGGTAVQLSPGSGGTWNLAVLHSFGSGTDGSVPRAGLTVRGNVLYGTTTGGGTGTACGPFGGMPCGTVYQLLRISANSWAERVIYSFGGSSDGGIPLGSVTFDNAGYLYGTTSQGGGNGGGTVYRLTPGPSFGGGWIEKTLYAFTGGSDGGYSYGNVSFDNAGNLYGTTGTGGTYNVGTVFQMQNSGGNWTLFTLHSFMGSPDASVPEAGVTVQGNTLYGTTYNGGTGTTCGLFGGPCGTVYQVTNNGGTWTESVVYSFLGGADAGQPLGNLYIDQSGKLYGTGFTGGSAGFGAVFQVTP